MTGPTEPAATAGAGQPRERIDGSTWLALGAMGLGVFVIANDVTAMSVALPAIERDLDSDVSAVQWVVNAYALIFGVLIVTGGRLADMFGRRRALFVGAALFALFSAVGAAAPDIGTLVAARALMGVGGALMWPAVLGLVYSILPDTRASLAGALVIGVAGVGNAAGPLIGGILTQTAGWRWILVLNVPIAALACLVTWRTVHVAEPSQRGRIDHLGIATISVGLVSLLLALDAAPDEGWTSPIVVGGLTACVVLLTAFVLLQRRMGPDALIPTDVFGNREFRTACIVVLLMTTTFFAALLYLPQYLQKILGWSALGSGAALLPLMGVFAVTSFAAGALYDKLGAKVVVSVGAACMAVGPVLWSFVDAEAGYLFLVPGMVVAGLGVGLFYSAITTAAVTSLDPSRTSLAGGVLYMFQVAGGAVGLGLTTTTFLTGSNRALSQAEARFPLDADEQADVRGVLAGTDSADQVLARFPGEAGTELVELVREAFAAGLRSAFRLDAALALAGMVVAVLFVGGRLGRRRADTATATATPTGDPPAA